MSFVRYLRFRHDVNYTYSLYGSRWRPWELRFRPVEMVIRRGRCRVFGHHFYPGYPLSWKNWCIGCGKDPT